MLPFAGPALPLAPGDIDQAATRLNCLVEAVQAVFTVETGGVGGFLTDNSGRPRILFEAELFGSATAHKWDKSHPAISTSAPNFKLYRGGAAEYLRLEEAAALDRSAALQSASWGLFQVLGENWKMLGFTGVEPMVTAMAASEGNQLEAFVSYCLATGAADALHALDWARFARIYNGPDYEENSYDTRCAAAFLLACGKQGNAPMIGWKAPIVAKIQTRLTVLGFACGPADAIFGPMTEFAVRRFEASIKLPADGICGPKVMSALSLSAPT